MQKTLKKIPFIIILASTLACESKTSFELGDCIQRPDSIDVWQIKEIDQDQKIKLVHVRDKERNKSSTLNQSWISTACSVEF